MIVIASTLAHWMPVLAAAPQSTSSSEPEVSVSLDGVEAWEAACVRRTQGGHPDAFNPLVAHYAPRIRAYLHRMLRNREEAEDLTQETFLRAFRALERFDPDRSFKRWIYTIATNTGLNQLRSQKRKGSQVQLDLDSWSREDVAGHAPGESRGMEQLEAAMASLSPRALQLVRLHYHEGFTLQEAGSVLGMSEGAAKAALCRARQELRKKIHEGGCHEL